MLGKAHRADDPGEIGDPVALVWDTTEFAILVEGKHSFDYVVGMTLLLYHLANKMAGRLLHRVVVKFIGGLLQPLLEKRHLVFLQAIFDQECAFPFEVLCCDDASTDRTAEILREYEARYPDKIRGYYETVNQYYNPDLHATRDLLVPLSSGEFFAFCECDDSWEDPLKLQRQVDFLRSHPDYVMCVHTAYKHIVGTDEAEDEIYPANTEDRDYDAAEIIRHGAGLFATNSFMLRREAYVDPPACFKMQDFSDYTILMYAAFQGKIRCLKEPMSRHNEGVKDSWTVRIWSDPEKHADHQKAMIGLLQRIDGWYEGKYHEAFAGAIEEREADLLETEYQIALKKDDRQELKKEKYRLLIRRDRNAAFHRMLNEKFPGLVRLKHKIIKD